MEKKMEANLMGYTGFRVVGFGFRLSVSGFIVELLGLSILASGLGLRFQDLEVSQNRGIPI